MDTTNNRGYDIEEFLQYHRQKIFNSLGIPEELITKGDDAFTNSIKEMVEYGQTKSPVGSPELGH